MDRPLAELWLSRASFLNLLQLPQREQEGVLWSLRSYLSGACFPVSVRTLVLIGGSASVSLSSLCGRALGIRNLHCPIFRAADFSSR